MKHFDVDQNSDAWRLLRAGKITASNMDRIVDLKGNARTGQMPKTYLHELLAEWLLGQPIESGGSPWTDRGRQQEESGVDAYEWERECVTEKCGFFTTDDELIGASPDRLVGDDGLLEIKTPSAVNHVANLLLMTEDYKAQVQCQLFVTGRDWVDLVSFNPAMPLAVQRFERDTDFLHRMNQALYSEGGFLDRLADAKNQLSALKPVAMECRCWTADRDLCKSRDRVEVEDGIPRCFACREATKQIEQEIFG